MESIYCKNILNEKVAIKPSELKKNNILNIINDKLKVKIEGRCIKQGFVKKNSLQIISRSAGKIQDGHFTGDIIYKIKFSVEVCNPPEGQIINCVVHNINKMGVLAGIGTNSKETPLIILLPRHQHQEIELFKNISVGDSISVEIIGKKFELNDTKIHIVASLLNKNEAKTIKVKIRKKRGGFDSMDISDKQNIELRMQIIDKYIRSNDPYDGDISNVINLLKENIQVPIWNDMSISEKNKHIEESINYIKAEEEIKLLYGEKWYNLTNIDKKNIIKDKIKKDYIVNDEIKENGSYDSSLLEI